MKHKTLYWITGAFAALCMIISIGQVSFSTVFSSIMAFPFEQISLGLRVLSLSGAPGNIVAILIYASLSLLPVALLFVFRKKRDMFAEDGLLVLLSALLFFVIYQMINPGKISAMMSFEEGVNFFNAILGGIVYTVLFGYVVLRALRLFFTSAPEKLTDYMKVALECIGGVFVFIAFGLCFNELLNSIIALRLSNTGNEHMLGASYVFLVFQFIAYALPNALNVLVVFAAINMLDEMRKDQFSEETVLAASRMTGLCVTVLKVTVLLSIAFNTLQLIFIDALNVVNISMNIPVFSIVFILVALLLVRLVTEGKQLKEENEMFI